MNYPNLPIYNEPKKARKYLGTSKVIINISYLLEEKKLLFGTLTVEINIAECRFQFPS